MAAGRSGRVVYFLVLLCRVTNLTESVSCTKSICGKDQRPVRKINGPKVWAFGCNMTANQGRLNKCCIEKEICMRTCGMAWSKCTTMYENCVATVCDLDASCHHMSVAVDTLIQGGDTHLGVCKAYRDTLYELCDCVPAKSAKDGADSRLNSFYVSFSPERLDAEGRIKNIDVVWKKWQGREAELYFELTRKYNTTALEMKPWPADVVAQWLLKEERERLQAEEEEAAQKLIEEERAKAAKKFAEEQELARQKTEEIEAKRAAAREKRAKDAETKKEDKIQLERRREEVQRLRAELESASKADDVDRATALQAELDALDSALYTEVLDRMGEL